MNDLETRLREALRRHDTEAPSRHEVAARAPVGHGAPPRQRARLVAVLAATVLVIAGAGVAGLALSHRDTHSSVTDPGTGAGRVVFVIDAVPGVAARDLALTDVHVNGRAGAYAALTALFAYRPPAGQANPWAGVQLSSVAHRGDVWRVDVRDAPDWRIGEPELVMQSLAWTLSTATESVDPIQVELDGRLLRAPDGFGTAAGVPALGYLHESATDVPWVHRTCEVTNHFAVVAGVRVRLSTRLGTARAATASIIHVGDTVRVLPDGFCFQTVTIGDARSMTWTAEGVGRHDLRIAGSKCLTPGFTVGPGGGCVALSDIHGFLPVQVIAR